VDPLVIVGGVGERVHPVLGDLEPLAGAEHLPLQRGQFGQGGRGGAAHAAVSLVNIASGSGDIRPAAPGRDPRPALRMARPYQPGKFLPTRE